MRKNIENKHKGNKTKTNKVNDKKTVENITYEPILKLVGHLISFIETITRKLEFENGQKFHIVDKMLFSNN